MVWLKWTAIVAGVLGALSVTGVAYGAWQWGKGTRSMLARLEAARLPPATPRYDAHEIASLPAPVQRFFRAVLQDGQPIVTAVSVRHTGSMNMAEDAQQWKPFTSRQRVVTRRPGFDWDARIMMLPGVPVHIHDAYIAGVGILRGAVFGLVPVVNMKASPELSQGELLRYLAEAAWYPTALLPSQGVRWEAMDDDSARATLVDGGVTATLTFRFHADGTIDTVRAQSRSRAVGDVVAAAPWQGRFWRYGQQAGMRVPMEGEVAWILPRGAWPYWRGTNIAMTYEFAP